VVVVVVVVVVVEYTVVMSVFLHEPTLLRGIHRTVLTRPLIHLLDVLSFVLFSLVTRYSIGYKDIFTEDSVETTYLKGKSGLLTRQGSNDANSYRTHSTSDYQTYFVYKNYEKDVGGATWGASYYRPNNILAAYYKVARIQRNDKMKRYFPTMRSPSAKGMWGGDFSK